MQTPSLTQLGDQIKMLWITDPWSTLDQSKDTTLRLMHEAIIMGIPTFWSATDQLFSITTPGQVFAVELKNENDFFNLNKASYQPISLSNFQQIHFRVDPPVDEIYCKIIDQLIEVGAQTHQILNPPRLIKNQSEKIPPDALMTHSPRMMVVQSENDISNLTRLFSNDTEVVSKPLHLAQSVGVKKHFTPQSTQEWKKLLQNLTQNFTQEILIEEFLPQINQGEVRMWFAGEKFIAALKKFPKSGDFRVLIDEGSLVSAHSLTLEEESISQEIGKSLKSQGILFAAIDLIGNKICDYNITSPGLLVQLEQVHGNENFAKVILNQALQFHVQEESE